MTPASEQCSNCRFFNPAGEGLFELPVCRRYPPVNDCWPQVEDEDWCGEWQGKPGEGAPPEV